MPLGWQRAKLLHKRQIISDRPMLDALAVLEAHDVDLVGGYGLVRGRHTHELAGVAPMHRAVHNRGVALRDHLDRNRT